MPLRLKMEGLQAELASIEQLLEGAAEMDDPVGEYQLELRKTQLQNELATIAGVPEKTASVALFFGGKPVFGSRGIATDFAASMLDSFQELVQRSFASAEVGALGERGPIPRRESANLMVTHVTKGSFGFVLDELSDQVELDDSVLKTRVEEVVTILERIASSNELDFEEAIEEVDPRMLTTLKDFFSNLHSAEATIRLVDESADISLDAGAIRRGQVRTEASSIEEREITVRGVLEGFLPERRKFELRTDDDEVLYGSVSANAAIQYAEMVSTGKHPIGEKWNVKLNQRIVSPLNRPQRTTNRLIDFLQP